MGEEKTLTVELQYGEIRHTSKGAPEIVMQELLAFISRVIPTYDVASKLAYLPDYQRMINSISTVARIAPDGQVLLLREDLPAEKAIMTVLLGASISKRFQKRSSDELYAEEIARSVKKALKTVRNTIAELQKAGLIERAARGTYRIVTAGVMKMEQELAAQNGSAGGKTEDV